MLWLVWHMWILIGLAFAGGVIAGWVIRGRSDETPERPMLESLDATVVAPVEAHPVEAEPVVEPVAEPITVEDVKPDPEPEPAPVAEPKPEPAPKPAAKAKSSKSKPKADTLVPADAPADDLTKIKGLGPKAAAALNAEGVSRFDQVATWKKADVEKFDALINGRGRIARDEWVKQAKALAKG